MFSPALRLQASLDQTTRDGLTRRRRLLESPCGPRAVVEEREILSFASNDYLGFANHPAIRAALAEGAERWGAGSGASALVSGHQLPQQALEDKLAQFVDFPRTLCFATGYMANLAIVPTLAGRGSAIFADRLNHASLIDAVQLACANGARATRYPHNDLAALERLLSNSAAAQKIIVTDGVFSMDGDLAPLPELLNLAQQHEAWLVVDDAHGFGVLGAQGQGSLNHYHLAHQPQLILMATLGKAAGVAGAFVAASETVVEYLLQKARTYMFTTAPPPALAEALCTSIDLIASADEQRIRLHRHASDLAAALSRSPWRFVPTPCAIQPLIIGDNQAASDLSARLWQEGLWVPAIRPPAVPAGTARLRISLSAAHNGQDIVRLATTLQSDT